MSDINRYSERLQNTSKAEADSNHFESGKRNGIDARVPEAVKKISADLPEVCRVLDVPSGTARFLVNLAGGNREDIATACVSVQLFPRTARGLRKNSLSWKKSNPQSSMSC